jgi:hypothetical protein
MTVKCVSINGSTQATKRPLIFEHRFTIRQERLSLYEVQSLLLEPALDIASGHPKKTSKA